MQDNFWVNRNLSVAFAWSNNPEKLVIAFKTHWSHVAHICVSKQTTIGSDNGLSLSLKTHRNNIRRNFNQNSYIFITEYLFENVAWKMAAISSRPQRVKPPTQSDIYAHRLIIVILRLLLSIGILSWWDHKMITFSTLLAFTRREIFHRARYLVNYLIQCQDQ